MSPGAVFVDHTTASANVARELHGAGKALGIAFVDAPVSGGQAGAQNGALTVMCGGDAAAFDAVTRLLDHVYIDMKHGGPREHRAGTGVENDLILANTAHAIAAGTDVLVRIPVIPGFNDSVQVAGMMAARLAEVGATRVQLLPFHNFGESKYDLLGRDYRLRGRKGLQPEDLEAYQKVFSDAGIDTFF